MIPYGRHSIDQDDIDAVVQSLRSDWLTQGPALRRFEIDLSLRTDAKFAVACNSGTAALHMAYSAAGVGPENTVIVPANTFLATANAAIYLGAEVRFCDVDADTGLMTAEALGATLDDSVRAVVPVHFAGQPCDMASIAQVIQERSPDAVLIEDACHAIGGVYEDGSPVGKPRYASMAAFSFHPVKHIAAGEGGAVTTNCPKLKERLEAFRNHGMTKDSKQLRRRNEGPWYYEMHAPGFNYRIPETACALAASQLAKLDRFIARRREIAGRYLSELADISHLTLPPKSHLNTSAWHLFCVHIDYQQLGFSRTDVMAALQRNEIGTQVHYFPVALQPYYVDQYGHDETQFPGALAHYDRALSIPLFAAMTDTEVQQVISAVKEVMASAARRSLQVA